MLLLTPFPHLHSTDQFWGMVPLTLGRPSGLSEYNQDCVCNLKAFSEFFFSYLILLRIKINHDRLLFIPAWTGLYLEERDTGNKETVILVRVLLTCYA